MEMPPEFPQPLLPAASWCWAMAGQHLFQQALKPLPEPQIPQKPQIPAVHSSTSPRGGEVSLWCVQCDPPCLGQRTSRGRAPKNQDNFKPGEVEVPARNPANPVLPKHPPCSPASDSHNENKCSNAYSNSLQMGLR